jgi:hypothetical protein
MPEIIRIPDAIARTKRIIGCTGKRVISVHAMKFPATGPAQEILSFFLHDSIVCVCYYF